MSTAATPATAALSTPPDPQPDRAGMAMPERIADMLCIVAILTQYGRHLADTIQHRALRRGFASIAQFFGTSRVSTILAHLHRGIMRAVALERLLLQRAQRGRDLVIFEPGQQRRRAVSAAIPSWPDAAAGPPQAGSPPARAAAHRPAGRTLPQEALTLDTLPSMRQIEAEVRRRPIGRTLVAICNDLGAAPMLCSNPMWESLYRAFRCYRGSFDKWFGEMRRRQKYFEQQQRNDHPDLDRPAQTREEIHQILGFLIGEPPLDPCTILPDPATPGPRATPVAPAGTGPP